jgi:hypothetical protein
LTPEQVKELQEFLEKRHPLTATEVRQEAESGTEEEAGLVRRPGGRMFERGAVATGIEGLEGKKASEFTLSDIEELEKKIREEKAKGGR